MSSRPTGTAEHAYARDRVIAGVEKLRFFPLAVESGSGVWLVESGGRKLLDLSASWTASALGHGHPAVTAAITEALAGPPGASVLSAAHPQAAGLAEDLLALVPGSGERRVYLGHSGSDANDVALRCARTATGRTKILSFEHSYHGGLGLAMRASGVNVGSGTADASDEVAFLPYPDPYRSASSDPLPALTTVLESVLGSDQFACAIVEPILSDGGLVVPPDGFLQALASACRRHGALLICDEVKVGLGRSGLLHAFEHEGITPDLVTFGKALGGGLPLSAAVGSADVLDLPTASALLTTAGNPICSAAGRAVLRTLTELDLAPNAARAGDRLRQGLRVATDALGCVGDIRGRGLVTGVDLVRDRTSRTRAPDLARLTVFRLWELGAVAYYVGDNVLEITPPLIIEDAEVDLAVELLARAIRDASEGRVDPDSVAQFTGW